MTKKIPTYNKLEDSPVKHRSSLGSLPAASGLASSDSMTGLNNQFC